MPASTRLFPLCLLMMITDILIVGATPPPPPSSLLPFSETYNIRLASEGYFDEGPGLIVGWLPAPNRKKESPAQFPLFVFNPGTGTLPNMTYALAITSLMAQRGYFAVTVQVDDDGHP